MHSLPEAEVDAFEEHFFVCAACAGVVEKTAEYVEAIHAAARKLRSESAALRSGPTLGRVETL